MVRSASSALMGLLLVQAGCRSEPPVSSEVAVAVDAGPALPPELQISVAVQSPELGTILVAFDEARPKVPQVQELRLRTNLPLQNYRIRVFDEQDRALASDDTAQENPDGLDYRLELLEPLQTGNRYALVVDPLTGAQLLDAHGRPHPEIRLEFEVEGERVRPPPAPKKPAPKKRRR